MNPMTLSYVNGALDWGNFQTSLNAMVAEFEYTGASPKQTMSFLMTREPSRETLASDMRVIAVLYFCRGTNYEKIKNKMGKDGIGRVGTIINKYAIIAKASNIGSPPQHTTIGRISQAVPAIFAKVASMMQIPNHGVNCPSYLRFPAAASIIPRDEEDMIRRHKAWCEAFGRVINPDSPFQERFWNIAHLSDYVSDSERESLRGALDKA